jgi:hypothetical protein
LQWKNSEETEDHRVGYNRYKTEEHALSFKTEDHTSKKFKTEETFKSLKTKEGFQRFKSEEHVLKKFLTREEAAAESDEDLMRLITQDNTPAEKGFMHRVRAINAAPHGYTQR